MKLRILQLLTSSTRDNRSNLLTSQKRNLVRQASSSKRTLGRRVNRATKINVINNSVASLLGISEENSALDRIGEGGALNQNLRAHTSVDTGKKDLVPIVVDEVDGGEADEGLATVDVLPVVVGVGDVEFALVFGGVVI